MPCSISSSSRARRSLVFIALYGGSLSAALLLAPMAVAQSQWDIRGNVTAEVSAFMHTPLHAADQSSNLSLSTEMEFYTDVGDAGSVTISPFVRIDEHDAERSHVDLREFLYTHVGDTWEIRAGLGKVFFGVAESNNPVDIINQRDSVENITTDAKLGQPMINLSLLRDWGDIDLYVLPGFRERPFPGVDGRPRLPFAVNTDATSYESSAENRHVDVAVRVARAWGSWDLGAHVFHGTARNPELRFDPTTVELQPFYALMTQVGIDAQATLESWLLKTELVHRQGKEFTDHVAGVTGFEYSFYDIQGSGFDLGIVGEYLFEDRDEAEADILQNDVLIGLRLALNDAASTEALAGVIVDLDEDEQLYSLEASRRFGSNFKASFAYTGWSDGETPSSLTPFDREDNVRFELGYFF